MNRRAVLGMALTVPAAAWLAGNNLPAFGGNGGGGGAGGPIILMGIDAEDGGPGGHGQIEVYENVVHTMYDSVSNGGSGILVIGGGKFVGDGADNVTEFWDTISDHIGVPVTYVNGAANITAQSFAGFAMIAVVSDEQETSSGGLTQAENDALAGRKDDIASFVNNGGGLLGFTSTFAEGAGPYAYLGDLGDFSVDVGLSYSDITPTAAGTALGITNELDVCCWHNVYTSFPSFLSVLATDADTGLPAVIGGVSVVVGSSRAGSVSAAGQTRLEGQAVKIQLNAQSNRKGRASGKLSAQLGRQTFNSTRIEVVDLTELGARIEGEGRVNGRSVVPFRLVLRNPRLDGQYGYFVVEEFTVAGASFLEAPVAGRMAVVFLR